MQKRGAIVFILAAGAALVWAAFAFAGTATYVYDDAGRLAGFKSGV